MQTYIACNDPLVDASTSNYANTNYDVIIIIEWMLLITTNDNMLIFVLQLQHLRHNQCHHAFDDSDTMTKLTLIVLVYLKILNKSVVINYNK